MKKKKILKMLSGIVSYTGINLCEYCKELGIAIKDCNCTSDKECSKNIYNQFKIKEDEKEYERENKKNLEIC